MPQRPILSDTSFLGFLFSPAKHEKPRGLRRRSLSGVKGGRNKRRLNAYNRMSAANQQLLKMAGLRDAYLTGDASLKDARDMLRPRAVDLGLARPLPSQAIEPGQAVIVLTRRQQLDRIIASHIKRTVSQAGKRFNGPGVDRRVPRIPEYISPQVPTWDYDQIRDAASTGSPFEVIESNGKRFNPFWYQ